MVGNAVLRELGDSTKFSRRRAACRRSSRAHLDAERKPAHGRGDATDVANQSAHIGHTEHEQAVGTKFVTDAEQLAAIDYTGDYAGHWLASQQSGKSELDDGSVPRTDGDTDNPERVESGGFGHIGLQQPGLFVELIGTRQQHGKHDNGAGHSAHYAVRNAVQTGNLADWRLHAAVKVR
jgi:hypothetical protein